MATVFLGGGDDLPGIRTVYSVALIVHSTVACAKLNNCETELFLPNMPFFAL